MTKYIYLEDLIKKLSDETIHKLSHSNNEIFDDGYVDGILDACKIANQQSTVNVVFVTHGRWIKDDSLPNNNKNIYHCSACNKAWIAIDGTPKENHMYYCHNCGADMGEKK